VKAVRDREESIHSRTHTYCINHRKGRREKKQCTSRNCVERKKAGRFHVKLVKRHIETYIPRYIININNNNNNNNNNNTG